MDTEMQDATMEVVDRPRDACLGHGDCAFGECTRPRWQCDGCQQEVCDANVRLQCQICCRPEQLCLYCVDEQLDGEVLASYLPEGMQIHGIQVCVNCAVGVKVNYLMRARAFQRQQGYVVGPQEPLRTRFRTRKECSVYLGNQILELFTDDEAGQILAQLFGRFVMGIVRQRMRSRSTRLVQGSHVATRTAGAA